MKRNRFRLIFYALFAISMVQCTNQVTTIFKLENGIRLQTRELNVRVQFFADNTVKVEKWLTGTKPDTTSLVVIQNKVPKVDFKLSETTDSVFLSTNRLLVSISLSDGQVCFKNKTKTLLKEAAAQFIPFELKNEKAYSIRQNFTLSDDEGIYGLGQHQYGYMNYRGKSVTLVQTNTDAVNPFFVSTKGYGILWDNYSKTIFDDTGDATSIWSEVADNIRYYFVAGNNMDEAIAGYRSLTGQAPMYGKWAYGYWQSKEHYENRAELLSIAAEYRKRKIPIDNIIQDWDTWEGNENWNQIFFDPVKFPQPKEMLDILHRENFHVMVSVWCSFGTNTAIYKEMQKRGFLFPTVGWAKFKYFDAYNPEACKLYWKFINNGFFNIGMDGWWMDSTEPDIVNANTKGATEYEMKRVKDNYLGTFARYLNTYSLVATESVYKNQRATSEKQRVYILTRSTFAGQQRAAATTWSGDIGANWDIYKRQIAAGINHSMSGIPYWTFDIGAFVLGGYGGVFIKGGGDPAYQELYTRMFQFGSFCPIFRSHGSETPREIWRFGNFVPDLVKFDKLRYRLMPYIYSLAGQVTQNGYTIMRGLAMDFPQDKNTYNIDDQYMFGPALMVCPVTDYMYNKPPERGIRVTASHFKTRDGKPGLKAKYYKDTKYSVLGLEKIDSCINLNWYDTGRPDYVTDSSLSITWEGKIIPDETGKYQFQVKCYGPSHIYLDGKELKFVYSGVEAYTEILDLEAGKEYSFRLEKENENPGAFHVELFWKTPAIFAKEQLKENREKSRKVYLPTGTNWIDFWTGKSYTGGQKVTADAPIDKIPLFVKAGSVVPMGPFVQYAEEKPDAPYEVRIYPGADGNFLWYEDENDNYNYEKGAFAEVEFKWNEVQKQLTIGGRKGTFPGIMEKRQLNFVIVNPDKGNDIEVAKPDKSIDYDGTEQIIQF